MKRSVSNTRIIRSQNAFGYLLRGEARQILWKNQISDVKNTLEEFSKNVEEKHKEIKVMRMIDMGNPILKLQHKKLLFRKNRTEQDNKLRKKGIENTFFLTFRKIIFYEKRSLHGHILAKYLLKYWKN